MTTESKKRDIALVVDDSPETLRLLTDALHGKAELFARPDSVEAAWRVVDPVLGEPTPVYQYEPNTWGPAEADQIVQRAGGWHNPRPPRVQG